MRSIKVVAALAIGIGLVFLLFVDPAPNGGGDGVSGQAGIKPTDGRDARSAPRPDTVLMPSQQLAKDHYLPRGFEGPRNSFGSSSRSFAASQLVLDPEREQEPSPLPLGTLVPAVVASRSLSSNDATPFRAVIPDDVEGQGEAIIPAGTKAIGQASFNEDLGRLIVHFQTLVFPDGSEHSLSAIAMSPDGSAGLGGTYHSGSLMAQVGRFLSTFTGGLAEGMKDKQQSETGITFEPGSLRNGALNGLSTTSLDQAKDFSDDLSRAKPYLEVSAGTPFLIYLEKGFGH